MVRKFRPRTPGQRKLVLPSNAQVTLKNAKGKKVSPCKALLLPKKRTSGRNHQGKITCRHRGGGHKRHYRIIDFKRDKDNIEGKVASIEYDPNRSAHIALLNYVDGEKRYIIAPEGIKVGDALLSGVDVKFNIGNAMPLKFMPLGSSIHNIEMYPGKGGQLVRSAGLSAQLMARSNGYATLKLSSGEVRLVNENC